MRSRTERRLLVSFGLLSVSEVEIVITISKFSHPLFKLTCCLPTLCIALFCSEVNCGRRRNTRSQTLKIEFQVLVPKTNINHVHLLSPVLVTTYCSYTTRESTTMDVLKALRARQPAVEFPKQNKEAPEKHYVLEKELGSYVDLLLTPTRSFVNPENN